MNIIQLLYIYLQHLYQTSLSYDEFIDEDISSKLVKYADDLSDCNALIIPGGESTTLTKLIFNIISR